MEISSRYIIGIDLGTTNSCVSYIDTKAPGRASHLEIFQIPQLVATGVVTPHKLLPSCCFLKGQEVWPEKSTDLPWKTNPQRFVGSFAKIRGSEVPTRAVFSAKSWLTARTDRAKETLLPLEAADDKVSPVQALSCVMSHIRDAWNWTFAKNEPDNELEEQQLIVCIPASFDELARNMTVQAINQAGIHKFTLLEEPQSAFYNWTQNNEKNWQKILTPGDSVLVVDVGGGTTDFTIIHIEEKESKPYFERRSVGKHLLLGGDNIDETLCHYADTQCQQALGKGISSREWSRLKYEMQQVKERLFDENSPKKEKIVVESRTSKVIGGSISFDVMYDEMRTLILEGFFGSVPYEEAIKENKAHGLKNKGLVFEDEPSIIKHLAQFLHSACSYEKARIPTHVLFNGGTMKPLVFQKAIVQSIAQWFSVQTPTILKTSSMDLAVARGAAYYGNVLRGEGIRIHGGVPTSFYLAAGIENDKKAIAILQRGTEFGFRMFLEKEFLLGINRNVSFELYTSSVRLDDKVEDIVDIDSEKLRKVAPYVAKLEWGKNSDVQQIPVRLEVVLQEIGVLELWIHSKNTQHKWKLDFQVRGEKGDESSLSSIKDTSIVIFQDQATLEKARAVIEQAYGEASSKEKCEKLVHTLETILGCTKDEWPLPALRALADTILQCKDRRKITEKHESRFWNILGLTLRPGFAAPLDESRMKSVWKILLSETKDKATKEVLLQKYIFFRRVAAGFTKGQQAQLAPLLIDALFDKSKGKLLAQEKVGDAQYIEALRTVASFEYIDSTLKIKIIDALLEKSKSQSLHAHEIWAFSRLCARKPLYALGHTVPKEYVVHALDKLLSSVQFNKKTEAVLSGLDPAAKMLLNIFRKSGVRETDIDDDQIHSFTCKLIGKELTSYDIESEYVQDNERQNFEWLGDSLPPGLSIQI